MHIETEFDKSLMIDSDDIFHRGLEDKNQGNDRRLNIKDEQRDESCKLYFYNKNGDIKRKCRRTCKMPLSEGSCDR